MTYNSLTESALDIVCRHGKHVLDQACRIIVESDHGDDALNAAMKYYVESTFRRVLPIFPALIHLSCAAVGGNPEKTKPLATALMLITASGDIHDDIIDKSKRKLRRKTVFGKYGKEVALLTGDAFLIQGVTLLNSACGDLPSEQGKTIFGLVEKSMLESIKSELLETRLWKKQNVTPQQYFEVLKMKGSVAELQCVVGGIVGCADGKALSEVASYGRTIGVLSSVKDEFMDMNNFPELRHRLAHELPPYPVIYACQNKRLKKQVGSLVSSKEPLKRDLQRLADLVLNSAEIQKLRAELAELGKKELRGNSLLNAEKGKEAALLLQALACEM